MKEIYLVYYTILLNVLFLFFFFLILINKPLEFGLIRKLTLALHISKGIQSIHKMSATHRDIKSKNVTFSFFSFFIEIKLIN